VKRAPRLPGFEPERPFREPLKDSQIEDPVITALLRPARLAIEAPVR
jgi:hypothetical protein